MNARKSLCSIRSLGNRECLGGALERKKVTIVLEALETESVLVELWIAWKSYCSIRGLGYLELIHWVAC